MQKQQYEIGKSRVDRAKRQDYQWIQAHHMYEAADCDGDIAKYHDQRWLQAHSQYISYKD